MVAVPEIQPCIIAADDAECAACAVIHGAVVFHVVYVLDLHPGDVSRALDGWGKNAIYWEMG